MKKLFPGINTTIHWINSISYVRRDLCKNALCFSSQMHEIGITNCMDMQQESSIFRISNIETGNNTFDTL